MLFFQIQKENKFDPLYIQIYRHIKENISEGKLTQGKQLPSKRELAEVLGVSVNTVANSYEQLLAEGFIYTIERKGYFVEDCSLIMNQPNLRKFDFPLNLKEVSEPKEGWISLSHFKAESTMFPFDEWMKSLQKAIKNHKQELSCIPHPQGPYIVRKTISQMIALSDGVACEPEQIVISSVQHSLLQQLIKIQPQITRPLKNLRFLFMKVLKSRKEPIRSILNELAPFPLIILPLFLSSM